MMTIYEVAEALEGMSDGDKEPRCWALVAAVRECVGSLDAIADQLEASSCETELATSPTC